MNKTVTANIAGFIFNIEEQAYVKLQQYLSEIEKNFHEEGERLEIMSDIEARIAELFQANISDRKEVINEQDVGRVIEQMGQPEDYATEESEEYVPSFDTGNEKERRLYRDTENAVMGGVCSGLSAYFGLDRNLVRVAFVFLTIIGFSGVLLYLVLLFIIPEAKTTNEKLKMRGAPINVDSIKQQAKEFKERFESKTKSGKYSKTFTKTFDKGVKVSSNFAKFIVRAVGAGLLMGGVFALLILFSVFIGEGGLVPFWGEKQNITLSQGLDILYGSDFLSGLSFTAILILIFIPIISLIYSGIKLLFDIQVKLKTASIVLGVLWATGIGTLALTSVQLAMEFRNDAEVSKNIEVEKQIDILRIEVLEDDVFSNELLLEDAWKGSELIEVEDDYFYLGYPSLKVIESEMDSTFKVEVIKTSRGISQRNAINRAENIEYNASYENGVLQIAPYMIIDMQDKMRGQNVEIIVRVPQGKSVRLGDNIERVLHPITRNHQVDKTRTIYSNTTWTNDDNKMIYSDRDSL